MKSADYIIIILILIQLVFLLKYLFGKFRERHIKLRNLKNAGPYTKKLNDVINFNNEIESRQLKQLDSQIKFDKLASNRSNNIGWFEKLFAFGWIFIFGVIIGNKGISATMILDYTWLAFIALSLVSFIIFFIFCFGKGLIDWINK